MAWRQGSGTCGIRFVVGCALLLSLPAAGRVSAQTIVDERVWWNLTAQERAGTDDRWRWYAELQGRLRDGAGEVDQLIVRPAIGYDLDSRSSVWVGYGYIGGYPAGGGAIDENRLWQQYLWSGPLAAGTFASRSRLEQRDIEGDEKLAWRVRQQFRYTRLVAPGSRLSAVVWDELFVHVNTTRTTRGGLDQNRAFGGIAVALNPNARVEVGYLNQFINPRSGRDRMHHVLSGVLNLTF